MLGKGEIKMNYLRTKPIGSVLKRSMFIVVLGLLLSSGAVYAESLKLLYAVDADALKTAAVAKAIKKPVEYQGVIGVDENGDVVIRSGNVSMIMAYNSTGDVQRFQDRARGLQPMERPLMNGISLTLCCLF